MSKKRLKAVVRGAGELFMVVMGLASLACIGFIVVALWLEPTAGPVYAFGFLVLLTVVMGLMRLVVAIAEWATTP